MEETLPKQAILVVNAGSRKGADLFAEARDKLTAAGVELLDAKKCKTAKTMETAVKSALKKAPMVIVGGGDGSLSSFVDYFIGKDVVFALLPLGMQADAEIPAVLEIGVDAAAGRAARELARRLEVADEIRANARVERVLLDVDEIGFDHARCVRASLRDGSASHARPRSSSRGTPERADAGARAGCRGCADARRSPRRRPVRR